MRGDRIARWDAATTVRESRGWPARLVYAPAFLEKSLTITVDSLEVQGQAFMAQYSEAFDTWRGFSDRRASSCPARAPALRRSTHCFTSRDGIAQFFHKGAATCAAEGRCGGRFWNPEVTPIGRRSRLATVDWEMVGAQLDVIRPWRQSYNPNPGR